MNLFRLRNGNSTTHKFNQLTFVLIPLLLACFGLLPRAQAGVSPAPDGGYPNGTTAEGDFSLASLTSGSDNTALGFAALDGVTTGSDNTGIGFGALFNNTADENTAIGSLALRSNEIGARNTAVGRAALLLNTIGNDNTAIGTNALDFNSGTFNIALGAGAGSSLTTGDFNIDIGNGGDIADTHTIRIGLGQTATFIAGISGVGVTGTLVVINGSGQLGTAPSSRRFKDEIKPMDKASEAILALKPVTFRYKKELDPDGLQQFGLVAEEVQKVNRDLVALDKEGKPYAVRYEQVNAMLLNEFLKEHRKVEKLEATVAQQQKQIKALVSGLAKVNAQIEVSKPAPQTVANNQ